MIDQVSICALPVSRQDMGFPIENDRGTALLLLASDMHPATRAAYAQHGCIHEGVLISSCAKEICQVLDAMNLRWCPWPDRGFTLAILPHARMGVLADRLIVSQLSAESEGKEEP